jgi:hypothetical protein
MKLTPERGHVLQTLAEVNRGYIPPSNVYYSTIQDSNKTLNTFLLFLEKKLSL